MKKQLIKTLGLGALLSFGMLTCANAATLTWDNGGVGNNWNTADNWDPNGLPGTGDDITIGSGFTVDYTSGGNKLPGGSTLNIDGTLSVSFVFRANGATVNVSSTGVLTAINNSRFYDWNNATVNFEDGAQFVQGVWENKGTNVFNFELGGTGFSTLTPSSYAPGNGVTQASATYAVDMASYTGDVGIITLVDWTSNVTAIDEAAFALATLQVNNNGKYTANLQWNEANSAIELNITAIATPEPSSLALILLGAAFLKNMRRKKLV